MGHAQGDTSNPQLKQFTVSVLGPAGGSAFCCHVYSRAGIMDRILAPARGPKSCRNNGFVTRHFENHGGLKSRPGGRAPKVVREAVSFLASQSGLQDYQGPADLGVAEPACRLLNRDRRKRTLSDGLCGLFARGLLGDGVD